MLQNTETTDLEIDFELELAKVPEQHKAEYKEVCEYSHCKREAVFVQKYLDALMSDNTPVISEMRAHCTSYRFCHKEMFFNLQKFEEAKRFGFTEFNTNEHGWFTEGKWPYEEEVELKVKGDKAHYNHVDLAQSPNGKWTYGYTYTAGSSGGCRGAGLYGDMFDTRGAALIAGLLRVQIFHKQYIDNKDNPAKHKAYSRSVLDRISEYLVLLGVSDGRPKIKSTTTAEIHSNTTKPGLYVCDKNYTNELGYKFKKGQESLYVWEWFAEEDFCICSFHLNDNRIHLSGPVIRTNWRWMDELPKSVVEPEKKERAKADRSEKLPVKTTAVENVDGLQQITLFPEAKIKAPRVFVNKYGYKGTDRVDRQRVERKITALLKKIKALPEEEQLAVVAAVSKIRQTKLSTPPQKIENESAVSNT